MGANEGSSGVMGYVPRAMGYARVHKTRKNKHEDVVMSKKSGKMNMRD